jgi:energy-coupling factor transporter ATP-binding protein EcfA2
VIVYADREMLKRIRLADFKSFVDEEVELAPVTVLVGANASGKSNLLDALWFLHGIVLHLPVDVVLDGEEEPRRNGEPWPGIRGGSAEASRLGSSGFELESVWSRLTAGTEEIDGEILYGVTCQTSPEPRLLSERLGEVGGTIDDYKPAHARDRIVHALTPENDLPRWAAVFAIERIRRLEVHPERMRSYGQIKRSRLAEDGGNFSGALYHLCRNPESRRDLIDWLTELLAPEVVDLDFIEVRELGDVMAVFVEKDGKRVSARSLSDGTLRFLGLLLTLRTAEPGSTLLIEEIDSGLHPARIHVLMELVRRVCRERKLQVIATTHAPTVLQSLDDEALRGAIVCGRVSEHEGTLLRRLGDLPHFDEVVKRKGIAELFATGWLEMAL